MFGLTKSTHLFNLWPDEQAIITWSMITQFTGACTRPPWWRHQMGKNPRYWAFVRVNHRSTVDSPHKGQGRGALIFSLVCAWTNGWANNRDARDLRRPRAHNDVTVMSMSSRRRIPTVTVALDIAMFAKTHRISKSISATRTVYIRKCHCNLGTSLYKGTRAVWDGNIYHTRRLRM